MSERDAPARGRLGAADLALGFLLLVLLGWYVHDYLDVGGRPEEDAAMLLRYSQHLAAGWGIVWNVGEAPIDGATDFVFMLLVAGLHALGVGLETSARAIGLLAHAATVLLVYAGARHLFGLARPWALVPAVFLAVGPGLRHLAACYGTPLFALFSTVAGLLAWRLACVEEGRERGPALAFALAALSCGLARPEGVFLGGFMLLSVLVARGGRGARAIVIRFLLVFLTLGLAYFLWRWSYFGHPLPNPFYKKGAGVLHWHSLRQSWKNLWALGPPFVALVALGLLVRKARRAALFTALPVVLFVSLFVLISDETNYVMRFRYPILPMILIGCVPVAQALAARAREAAPRLSGVPAWASWPVALALAGLLAFGEHRAYRFVAPKRMGLYDAAMVLRDYAPRGFALATTEAGLLPFYSEWRAVDAWGLNDAYVAHHGGIDEAYLDRYRPEVIAFHAFFSPGVPDHGERVKTRSLGPSWYRMVMTLKGYAESHGYELAACFGRNEWDTHYYYVRRGFHQSEEIVARLRALDYDWDGQPTIDFAAAVDARRNRTEDPAIPREERAP
jgi:arabinofuranosyltransferase